MGDLKEFINELDRVIKTWPEHAQWAVSQIAMYTKMSQKHVCQWLSAALGRPIDSQDRLGVHDGGLALANLKTLLESGGHIEAPMSAEANRAAESYASVRAKLTPLLKAKNWRQAYKNLSYFLGQRESTLPIEEKLEGYAECLRLGLKAAVPTQELAVWLKNGVEAALQDGSHQGLKDALDLIDAYGEHFVESQGGNSFLQELFKKATPAARKHDMTNALEKSKEALGLA